uniref:Uncharacterized protein n=1 Tax=Lepeophtheirus salmonis TaxID=72036 RepID=A0A0K2VCH6_LEPSM
MYGITNSQLHFNLALKLKDMEGNKVKLHQRRSR